jgi:hypothetical protein
MFNYFNIHDYYFLLSQQNRKKSIYLSIYIGCNDLSLSLSLSRSSSPSSYLDTNCAIVSCLLISCVPRVCVCTKSRSTSLNIHLNLNLIKKIYMILSTYYRFNNRFFIKHNISYIMMTICVTC